MRFKRLIVAFLAVIGFVIAAPMQATAAEASWFASSGYCTTNTYCYATHTGTRTAPVHVLVDVESCGGINCSDIQLKWVLYTDGKANCYGYFKVSDPQKSFWCYPGASTKTVGQFYVNVGTARAYIHIKNY